jgi:UDP-N-acetylglucosamine 2-epimerase (non-hydrolysing)
VEQAKPDLHAMIRVLVIAGTRPEVIKLAPVIKKLEEQDKLFVYKICITGQHRELLHQALNTFRITPDYDLNIMKPDQDLFDTASRVLLGLREVLSNEKPDWTLVQGDTTTATAASLAAFYYGSKVGHVEAGLRSHNKYAPFPEEANRRVTDALSDLCFAPTQTSKDNLLSEGVPENNVVVTGNTVIDALFWTVQRIRSRPKLTYELSNIDWNKRLVLVTGHRRESFGGNLRAICNALLRLARACPDINIVYAVHPNPNVQRPINNMLGNCRNVHVIPPQNYRDFVWLMTKAYIILTDSGGIQEEGPALNKPVLVMRDFTERPEGIEAGTTRLTGLSMESIVRNARLLLEDSVEYAKMARAPNPYGDGLASGRVVEGILASNERSCQEPPPIG